LGEYEKALGPDHISTLTTVHNLGLVYADQGKLKEVEEIYQRIGRIQENPRTRSYIDSLDTPQLRQPLY
jgi:hypothetical protein